MSTAEEVTWREKWAYLFRQHSGRPEDPELELNRSLSTWAVLFLAVGSVIGTGIFVILGVVVPLAGPAVVLSFIMAGIVCLLSGLSYAEVASTLPSSGSVYSYTYASVGELAAWVVGWCLILDYGVGVAAVSVGWAEYLNAGLQQAFGWQIPDSLSSAPQQGGILNLPAALLVLVMAAVVSFGVQESARVNSLLVLLKLALIAMVLVITFSGFESANLTPFAPLGIAGVLAAAGKLVFAYAGFDAAAVAGAEAKNPRKAVPIAILGALSLITVLYTLVALAAVAARPWQEFDGTGGEAVLATLVVEVSGNPWTSEIISVGAIIAIISVVLALLYTLSRIIYTMSKDGLLPKVLGVVSPKRRTPVVATWSLAGLLALLAAFVPLGELAAAISLGTLVAFTLVNVSVLVLRRTRPELPRLFRVPGGPVIPVVAIILNVILLTTLPGITWIAFSIWLVAGVAMYFGYSRHRSVVGKSARDLEGRSEVNS